MRKNRFTLLVTLLLAGMLFSGCDEDVHLNQNAFTKSGITVTRYQISRITSVHEYVDIERWGHTKNIYEANPGGIDTILINADTLSIMTSRRPTIYYLAALSLGCRINVDSVSGGLLH